MAVDTIYLDRSTRFAIKLSVAVIVLAEMTIGALHSFFEMNVREVDGFAKALGIVKCDLPAVRIEPVAFAVVRVNAAINPAMTVEIGELGSLQQLVEFR